VRQIIEKELTIELLLAEIENFSLKNGYAPSVRDLTTTLDLKSTSTTHKYLAIAKRRGLVSATKSVARSLRVTKEGKLLIQP
jgi:SOS-response transcriptional repressor LexA